jgi:hypothetical protein
MSEDNHVYSGQWRLDALNIAQWANLTKLETLSFIAILSQNAPRSNLQSFLNASEIYKL